ncbi:MAG: lysylphosphatidylglycerol synthase transmembrane domain-containing protein [Actinomycetota bacterium]|nr:lysylphosphatidylglycerol synthase transmembrane domain-containing protein [Actinomycetota bacterium]
MGDELEARGRRVLDKSRLKRGLILAITLSAAALVAISLLTLNRDTFDALSDLSLTFLLLAVALSLGRWIWSAIRIRLLLVSTDKAVLFRNLLKIVYGGYFTGLITPWRAGGVTGEAAFLYIYGLEAGEAVAIVSFGACVSTILLILFFPLAIWLSSSIFEFSFTVQGFLFSALAVGLIFLALVLLAILRPHTAVGQTLLRHSPSFLRRRERYRHFLERLGHEIQTFALSLRQIVSLGVSRLTAVVILTLLYWTFGFMAVPVALVGLGYGSYFGKAIVAQLVVQVLLPFIPTPGGSGFGEFGFLYIYSTILPETGVAGLLTLIWRFFDFYLGLIVGGGAFIVIMRDLSRMPGRKALDEEEPGGPEDRDSWADSSP